MCILSLTDMYMSRWHPKQIERGGGGGPRLIITNLDTSQKKAINSQNHEIHNRGGGYTYKCNFQYYS